MCGVTVNFEVGKKLIYVGEQSLLVIDTELIAEDLRLKNYHKNGGVMD